MWYALQPVPKRGKKHFKKKEIATKYACRNFLLQAFFFTAGYPLARADKKKKRKKKKAKQNGKQNLYLHFAKAFVRSGSVFSGTMRFHLTKIIDMVKAWAKGEP